ncbi:hypothetical protein ACQ5SK_24165 [Bradyrhizobium japonicum]
MAKVGVLLRPYGVVPAFPAVPVLLDGDHFGAAGRRAYRPWNSSNYNPFWTWKPTWDHVRYLFEETLFASWLWNTTFIALASTAISLVCGVFAGYALSRLNFHLPAAWAPPSSLPISCLRRCCSFRWQRSYATIGSVTRLGH